MFFNYFKFLFVLLCGAATACGVVESSSKRNIATPTPAMVKITVPTSKDVQTAVFAGGCFWGLEAVFEHINGVSDVTSGYSGGDAKTAAGGHGVNVEVDAIYSLVRLYPACRCGNGFHSFRCFHESHPEK